MTTPDTNADLLADYEALGNLLTTAEGSAAAAIVRERRILRTLIDQMGKSEEVPLVDQLAGNVVGLAPRRRSRSAAARSSA